SRQGQRKLGRNGHGRSNFNVLHGRVEALMRRGQAIHIERYVVKPKGTSGVGDSRLFVPCEGVADLHLCVGDNRAGWIRNCSSDGSAVDGLAIALNDKDPERQKESKEGKSGL